LLVEHRQHQVCGFNELMFTPYSQALSILQSQLKF
jgi:hypothetical protein